MNRKPFRLAAAAVSAVALLGLTFGATPAFADPGDPYSVGGVNQEASNQALVNPDATVQLSIHKYLGAPTTLPNNGTEQTVTGIPALQGVNFDVAQVLADGVAVDFTTNEGWAAASALTGASAAALAADGTVSVGGVVYTLGTVNTVVTDGTGTATFRAANGVGLYFVNENLATSGTVTNVATGQTVDKATVTPAAPFFVTLPMTNPDDTTRWMYDVNVYPKNQSDSATKEVADQGTVTAEDGNVGEHGIEFTIRSSITAGMTGETMGLYRIIDVLDARLAYVGTTVAIDADGAAGATAPVVLDSVDYEVVSAGNADGTTTVTVELTASGRDKAAAAKAANPGAQVVTVISTTVEEEGNGIVPNQAVFIPNQSSFDEQNNEGIPTNETETYYGDVIINKQDPAETGVDMTGATFAIYADPTRADGTCSTEDVTGQTAINSKAIDNAGLASTDEGYNQIRFVGLQASNWFDNAAVTDPAQMQYYCLVETQAPEGYNLDATPIRIMIDYNTAVVGDPDADPVVVAAPAFTTQLVNNEKSNLGNGLPLTGGEGVAAMSLGGLVLIGGGVAYYYAASRKRKTVA